MKLKTITKVGAALTAAFALASVANAAQIIGSINFSSASSSGVVYQDANGDPTSLQGPVGANPLLPTHAHGILSWGVVEVDSSDGSYTSVANGSIVSMNATPWVFNPSTGYTPFWTVGNFSFAMTSSTILFQGAGGLVIQGTGVMTTLDNSLDATTGTWTYSSVGLGTVDPNEPARIFSFSANNNSVPDGGATVALLGFSLLGLHGVRRKFAKR